MSTPAAPHSPSQARMGWLMPPFLQELPLDATDEDNLIDEVCDRARIILEGRNPEEQAQFAVILFQLTVQLIEQANAVYAGMAFLDIDGRTSMATILVSQITHDGDSDVAVCSQTEDSLRRAYPGDDIRIVFLPRVPAVTRIGADSIFLSAEIAPDGQAHAVPRNLVQAYVPIPHSTELLIFELSTTCLEDWDLYSELFAEILRTIDYSTDEDVAEFHRREALASAPSDSLGDDMRQDLRWHSSRVLEACVVRGRFIEDQDWMSGAACSECWSRGLRSSCTAQHHWRVGDLTANQLTVALEGVSAYFTDHGWKLEDGRHEGRVQAQQVGLSGDGRPRHSISVNADMGEGHLTIEVQSECRRQDRSVATSDFG